MNKPVKLTPTIEARRQDLIRGTIKSIAQLGYTNSTVQSICDAAGLSRGLIGHYFNGKEDLLLQAFRHLANQLDDHMRRALKPVGHDPFRRLLAAAIVSFSEPHARRETAPVWLAFSAVARWNPEMLAVHRELYGRYRRWIERMIQAAAADRGLALDSRVASLTFTQLVDGLWFGWVVEQIYDLEEARHVLCSWVFETFHERPENHADLHDILAAAAPLDLGT
ncbi:TetR family transcriptional regulator C-terminal domain-containing protein [Rhodoligotrophos defluvii]|uniref:TetR family transcriptional regulator C-terminal domain-containing protein n=1 Tax=Rhodoligotrophos defluvii TaxID=2561934 RepID=UPI0010C9C48C|nr:TetR family transcriptional regulator C-terminal domain-containing protein [Rhodoligotrophos defluvii]